MMTPDTVIVDGRAYSWRRILGIRRRQPTLFALREKRRPASQRTAASRFREPGLLD